MLADIGLAALVVSFLVGWYATAASAYGGWRGEQHWAASARNATLLVVPLLTIAVLVVVYSLYTLDFRLAYVADVASQNMSPFLRLTALWEGKHFFFDAAPPAAAGAAVEERLLVGEIYVLSNTGDRTVALPIEADSAMAPLAFTLPANAQDLDLENNQHGRFKATDDGFVDTAPLRPGQGTAEVMVHYTLPYDNPQTYSFSASWPVDGLNVLLPASTGLTLDGQGLEALETRQMGNGVEVVIFNREGLAAGETVTLLLSGDLNTPSAGVGLPATAPVRQSRTGALLAPVIVILGVLLIGLALWLRRGSAATESAPTGVSSLITCEGVISETARLDEARQIGQVDEADYARRRGQLFAQARKLAPEG